MVRSGVVVGVGVVTAGLFLPAALSDPPAAKPAEPVRPPAAAAKAELKVKTFRLERTNGLAVKAALADLLGPQDDPPILPPVQVWPAAFGGTPGGFGGFGGGGFGGFGGGIGGFNPPNITVTVNPPPAGKSEVVWRAAAGNWQGGVVVVRGSDRHLAVAADVVALLDRVPGSDLPELKAVWPFRLKHVPAAVVADVVRELAVPDLRAAAVETQLVLAVGPDAGVKTLVGLVADLDVPPKK